MRRMFAHAFLRGSGIVRLLCPKVDFSAGDFPVTMSTWPALLVEFQIVSVARISVVAAPHLNAGTGIAREECNVSALTIRGIAKIRAIEILFRMPRTNFNGPRHAPSDQSR